MSARPPLDVHAHIDANIDPRELRSLGTIFAATRSLDEADIATLRSDENTVWGVGCHPAVVGAHKAFTAEHFADLTCRTAFVSEVGLDGGSRVPLATQQATLDAVLQRVQDAPRITSIHSYKATAEVIEALERRPITGAILHWWLGSEAQTRRAVELGCFFSVNAASVRRTELLRLIPSDRLLTETDHPFGNRRGGKEARPGEVTTVENQLARLQGTSAATVRAAMWTNLGRLVSDAGCSQLLPHAVRRQLLAS
jgi:TatD DNase family protein